MRKQILPLLILLTVSFSVVYFFNPNADLKNLKKETMTRKERKEFNNAARKYQEFLMLRDPRTNRIPENIRNLELRFTEQLPKHFATVLLKGSLVQNTQALTWTERGPNNVAGRVRALAIDVRSTSDPITMLAGGASGGMWKSTDGGSTWVKKTIASQLHSVTCVAQDTRSGSEDVWYYGTGKYRQ